MLSWVAMERIYEREVLPDAKLRKQAGERPLRADAKRLTDGELLAKLRSFGIEIDRTWLEQAASGRSRPRKSPGRSWTRARQRPGKRLDLDLFGDTVGALVSRPAVL